MLGHTELGPERVFAHGPAGRDVGIGIGIVSRMPGWESQNSVSWSDSHELELGSDLEA